MKTFFVCLEVTLKSRFLIGMKRPYKLQCNLGIKENDHTVKFDISFMCFPKMRSAQGREKQLLIA